ncbi:hypothetical protein Desaci_4752 (plasmid) [Desulfosporosinus acidiphilus SJ4]|uniref:Uncharacterized protein n=1 Tax=Desulfosporosinus acidiphilus (strain DSM 22704 / JCM 16185 / SJ4) TaxID=646529 RepID=I4DCQ4_DESAJ|nr:hypothetical protein [Desulfosporosinus acidiphilus]AFM43578.1 hypothetical protein Desaci_4752 [Desulfosporosinus acidiphilus SJ4]
MKILMKPVDMIAHFVPDDLPHPLRLRTSDDDGEPIVISIKQIFTKSVESVAKQKFFLYRCQCDVNGLSRPIELKYDCSACKWYIFKF